MRLRYTAQAIADLERLHEFITRHDPSAAQRISKRLLETLEKLAGQPASGRPLDDLPVRQWVAGDYVARYLILDDEIIVVRVWHGREDR